MTERLTLKMSPHAAIKSRKRRKTNADLKRQTVADDKCSIIECQEATYDECELTKFTCMLQTFRGA